MSCQGGQVKKGKRSFAPKWLRRLHTKSRCIESRLRQLNQEKLLTGFNPDASGRAKVQRLQQLTDQAKRARVAYSEAARNLYQRKARNAKLANTKLSPKQFWKLVRKVDRKSGGLSAVKDADGNLHTDIKKIEEIVLEELSKIFSVRKSKIFSSRNEQLIKEVLVKEDMGWEEWIPTLKPNNEYEEEICRKVDITHIDESIKKIKEDRAPGVDGITANMLKLSSLAFRTKLTELVNEIIQEGEVPESLLIGKMTLIDKKEPSLQVGKKRPLCVSSVMLNVITKILHTRMDKICEREGFYGEVQYGFRKGKSTSDCVFMLLAAIRKAKKKRQVLTIAFCDIAKAYDSVNRELLYTKLDSIGFGGKIKRLIQSMYYNDSVQVKIGTGLSSPLWFTRGVKQGCVLSPLLFALYIATLGNVLHTMKEGVTFEGVVVSALFFADDLVLISRTKRRGMERMLRAVNRFCEAMKMTLSVEKTVILTAGTQDATWTVSDSAPDLEATISSKYLGIDIQVKGRNLIKEREVSMIRAALKYAHTIMGFSRVGQDKARVAYILWERCAVPAILYATEAMNISKTTVTELNRIQNLVARFILQLPKSVATAAAYVDGGMKPMDIRIQERTGMFVWKSMKSSDRLLAAVFQAVRNDNTDPWCRTVDQLVQNLGAKAFTGPKRLLKQAFFNYAVSVVLAKKRDFISLNAMSQPTQWFKLPNYVNDSATIGVLNRCRAGDSGLGNRRPNSLGKAYKQCPLCLRKGLVWKLDEEHVITRCPALDFERNSLGVTQYMDIRNQGHQASYSRQFKEYLGGDNAPATTMARRAGIIQTMISTWLHYAGARA